MGLKVLFVHEQTTFLKVSHLHSNVAILLELLVFNMTSPTSTCIGDILTSIHEIGLPFVIVEPYIPQVLL